MLSERSLWWLWCLMLVVGFGGCIGSFINVVIYRLPRNIPLGRPKWSFCPNCRTPIKWYDNIPVLSYFRLGGHCRVCACPIAPRYVIVETLTIVAFVVLFDAFFVAGVLRGITSEPWTSVSYRFYSDWPIAAAHAVLFACLIAMSAIDLEEYWVDIRYTHLAAAIGFVCHALWTPVRSTAWPRPGATLAAGALLAMPVIIITHVVVGWIWRRRFSDEPQEPDAPEEPDCMAVHLGRRAPHPHAVFSGVVLAVSLALLIAHLAAESPAEAMTPRSVVAARPAPVDRSLWLRSAPALAFALVVMLGGSVIRREADDEIEEALEAERHTARRTALLELVSLLPTVLAFAAGVLLCRPGGPLHDPWLALWHWQPWTSVRPLWGLGTAAGGFLIAGGIGWAVRILFTGLLGKEAFGSGDIHIMAAAGAVAGWEVVLIGFLLSSPLALFGKLVTLPFKGGRTLPMGPWLTLALFLAVLLRDPLMDRYFEPVAELFRLL